MAVFLVVGGLLLSAGSFRKPEMTGVVLAHRGATFFISTAKGAETASALFGARAIPSISAVSGDGAQYLQSSLSAARGAIKDPGYISSLNR